MKRTHQKGEQPKSENDRSKFGRLHKQSKKVQGNEQAVSKLAYKIWFSYKSLRN